MLDAFNSDLFTFTSLTSAVNRLPRAPMGVGEWLNWNSEGVTTDTVMIDIQDGDVGVIPMRERGAPASKESKDSRFAFPLRIPHYPRQDEIPAASLQGVRDFGSDNQTETIEKAIAKSQAKMVRKHDTTLEFARARALNAEIVDSDGTVVAELFPKFNQTQQIFDIELSDPTTNVVNAIVAAKRLSTAELGDSLANGFVILADPELFDAFIKHPTLQKAYDRWNDGAALRADNRDGLLIASNVTLVSYDIASVGNLRFIEAGKGFLCPLSDDLYQTRFGPAAMNEAINTIGLPLYSKSKPMDWDRGVELLTESNHVSYVTRPRSIIKITKS